MHSALLIIEKPNTNVPERGQAWQRILQKIEEQLNLYTNMRRIGENSLEIELNNSMPALVNLQHIAQVEHVSYQVLFFEKEPGWIRYNP